MTTTTSENTLEIDYSDIFKNSFKFLRLLNYEAKFPFRIETEKYVVKTAEKMKELYPLFKLRHECFYGAVSTKFPFVIDIDKYDASFDHVIIVDKESDQIVGTYRMQTSTTTESFYSQSEFNLDTFLKEPGIKLELGRACIHPDFRNGAVIDLLWRGISKYMQLSGARFLFGCSSMHLANRAVEASALNNYMRANNLSTDIYKIHPVGEFVMELDSSVAYDEETKKLIPPLLRSYMQAGAQVHGNPAYDADMDTVDCFTILDMRNVTPSFARRYFPFIKN